ncbi:fungal-specific transcription factor domain-containing protein [Achaetomium macrosporum]|uniref:Fungal-specific transcription factor domain-containing protein n=1 Tax=Achaetomium macrosporum TaxID=79813 RepID=A0AAN7C630_9PEZI|nr:fungal-specific transcription factor domain-containing protein [Achaetomium macrosporum]
MDHDALDSLPQGSRSRQQPGAACDNCRRRKLRCDRQKPQCGTCRASDIPCLVSATNPARGPKRGYLKTLQARIAALEGALAGQQGGVLPDGPADAGNEPAPLLGLVDSTPSTQLADLWALELPPDRQPLSHHMSYQESGGYMSPLADEGWFAIPPELMTDGTSTPTKQNVRTPPDLGSPSKSSPPLATNLVDILGASTDDVKSGLVQSDLDQLYVDRIHVFIPIVHLSRFSEWRKRGPASEAQAALRQAIWTLAASTSPVYHCTFQETIYRQARDAVEGLDQRSDATHTEHVQAWVLLAIYELMWVGFRRAWISAGRAFRLLQLDPTWSNEPEARVSTSPPDGGHTKGWVEAEERRRTFWMAYCLDRLISLQNGSPPTFSEKVLLRLPCPEARFESGKPVVMGFLSDLLGASNATTSPRRNTSPFVECIMVATVAGFALSHRAEACASGSSPTGTEGEGQQNGQADFWTRHFWLDGLVSNGMNTIALEHPPVAQDQDPTLLFLALAWRATMLHLWQTAKDVHERNGAASTEAVQQVEKAAQEVLRLMGKLSSLNGWTVHPLLSIPLALCAKLLEFRRDLKEDFEQKLDDLMQATHGARRLLGARPTEY